VTAEVALSGTFNDYGGDGPTSWSGTYEAPLWNCAQHGPDLIDAACARFYPFIYRWTPVDGPTITFPFLTFFSGITGGLPNFNGNFHFYYAQISAANKNESPLARLRLNFEPQLGVGTEYADAGLGAQQIVYPYYAGLGSSELDLGASGLIPNLRAETYGSNVVYPTGDADFADMIEDTIKSGILQLGPIAGVGVGGIETYLGDIQRGVNCNEMPGAIQKTIYRQLEPDDPTLRFNQANQLNSILIGISSWRQAGPGSPPTIADTAANAWTPVFATGNVLNFGVWTAQAVAAGNNDVTFTYNGNTFPFDVHAYLLEMDPASDTVEATNSVSGTTPGPGANTVSLSVTTAGPSFLIATFFVQQGFITQLPLESSHWKTLFTQDDFTQSGVFYRRVAAAGTYTFNLGIGGSGGIPYGIVMLALSKSQPARYPAALGLIVDPDTLQLTRLQDRANGLQGIGVFDSQKPAAEWLKDLVMCANTAPVWSGFRLKLIPWSEVSATGQGAVYTSPTASGPIADLGENDFIGDGKNPIIEVSRTAQVDAPNVWQIEHVDRQNNYDTTVTSQADQGSIALYGTRKQSPITLHEVASPLVARMLLGIIQRRQTNIRNTYKGKLKQKWFQLEPMDLVTITEPKLKIDHLPVRVTKVVEDEHYNIDAEFEPFIYGVHAPIPVATTTAAPFQSGSDASAGNVNAPVIFEAVPRLTAGGDAELWLVISSPSIVYGGAIVYISTDGGAHYNPVPNGVARGNAAVGVTTADWPAATDPDTTNDLPLDLTQSLGTLNSYQTSDEDNFTYPCWIEHGNPTIPYGLMTYAVAQLIGTNLYTLKATGGGHKLRRCVFGAPAPLNDVDHPSGSRWAFLDPSGVGIVKIVMDPRWIGVTLHFKILSFNVFGGGIQSLSDPGLVDYTFTPTGLPASSVVGSNNQYVQTPIVALSQFSATQINMAQVTEQFSGNSANYNARTFTITDPGSTPTVYYVTIQDPGQLGDTGTGTTLTAFCETSNAKVGQPGYVYIGFIQAAHVPASAVPAPGGWPPPQTFIVN